MQLKKVISLITSVVMLFGSFNIVKAEKELKYKWHNTSAEVDEYIDENSKMYYHYAEENNGITIYYARPDDDKKHITVEFPSEIDGKPVTKIGKGACLSSFDGTKKVVFPDSLKEIDDENFEEIKSLEEIDFGSGIERIGYNSFSYCTQLTDFTLPDSLTDIDDMAFVFCGVESIKIPDGITKIKNCFNSCYELKEIDIPDGVTSIEGFMGCDSLKSVKIPSSVTELKGAFYNCPNLETVEWDCDSVKSMTTSTFGKTKYKKNYPEEYILIDNGKTFVEYVGDSEEFTVLDGVKKIGSLAFSQGQYGEEESTLKSVTIPDSVTELSPNVFNHALELEKVVLSENITVIPANAFLRTAIKKITVPEGITTLCSGAFSDCTELKSVKLPNTLKKIGDNCFSGCTSLSEIELPESLTHIGTKVFKDCSSLKKLNIPDGIASSVNKNTFYAFSVETVDYDGKVTNDIYESLPKKAWEKAVGDDEDFVIVDGVLKSYNGNDKHIKIPDGVKEISKRAFFEKEFETVEFPSSLEKIGEVAFYATPITEVTIPSTVRIVGEMSFAQCPSLKKVVVENGVKQIDALAFAYCNLLDDMTIGESVKVAGNAFDDTPYRYGISAEEYNSPEWEAPTGVVPMPTPKPSIEPKPTEEPNPSEKPQLEVKSENGILGVTVDGKAVEFGMTKPFIDKNDRTQIPVRAVSEMMGSDVEWDGENKIVTVNHGDDVIKLTIGSDIMYVNGEAVKMDTQAVIVDDRTYIPIRYVGEMIGCEVVYNGE